MDEDLGDLTAIRHVGKHRTRCVRVHVHLEVGVSAHKQLAIPDRREKLECLDRIDFVAV